jgi:predicted dienelactone hydrolase
MCLVIGNSLLMASEAMAADAVPAGSVTADASRSAAVPAGIGRIETLVLHDPSRKKDLQCRVTYPSQAAAPCPIVIFSHGALGSKDGYDYLIDYLAARGYVCVQPTHADSMKLAGKTGRIRQAREIINSLPHDSAAWDNRAKDISFIIDSLPVIQKQVPVRLDDSKIACGGHSFGAFTTALIGGAEPPSPATRKDYRDNRVSAAIMMSPQGIRRDENDFGFADKQAWNKLTLPCLFLTGTLDNTKWTQSGGRAAPFLSCPPGDKYLAVISGAAHMTFSGRGNGVMVGDDESGKAPPIRQLMTKRLSQSMTPEQGDRAAMLSDICKLTTSFLDAYLNGNAQAKAELSAPNAFGSLVDLKAK